MARNFQCELGGRYDHLAGRVGWVCRFGLCKPLGLSIATALGQARRVCLTRHGGPGDMRYGTQVPRRMHPRA